MDNYRSNGTSMAEFDDAELEELYNWVDSIPLTRPKKNIARDFSDGGKKQRTSRFFFKVGVRSGDHCLLQMYCLSISNIIVLAFHYYRF